MENIKEIEEVLMIAKSKGWTCEPDTGRIFNISGNIPKSRQKYESKKTGKLHYYIPCNIRINKKIKGFYAHQFIFWFVNKYIPDQIDHIEHHEDPVFMNRINNLRPSNNRLNQMNQPSAKGYYFNKSRNKYQSQIVLNDKRIYLGRFDNEEEARQTYLKAKELHQNEIEAFVQAQLQLNRR